MPDYPAASTISASTVPAMGNAGLIVEQVRQSPHPARASWLLASGARTPVDRRSARALRGHHPPGAARRTEYPTEKSVRQPRSARYSADAMSTSRGRPTWLPAPSAFPPGSRRREMMRSGMRDWRSSPRLHTTTIAHDPRRPDSPIRSRAQPRPLDAAAPCAAAFLIYRYVTGCNV